MINDLAKPIIIRVPIIPGFTNSYQNIRLAVELLAELESVERVDLMHIMNMGELSTSNSGLIIKLMSKLHPENA